VGVPTCVDLGMGPLSGCLLGMALPIQVFRMRSARCEIAWILPLLCLAWLFVPCNDLWAIADAGWAAVQVGLTALGFLLGIIAPADHDRDAKRLFFFAAAFTVVQVALYSFWFQGFQVWYTTSITALFALASVRHLTSLLRPRPSLVVVLLTLQIANAAACCRTYAQGVPLGTRSPAAPTRSGTPPTTGGDRLDHWCSLRRLRLGKDFLHRPSFPITNLDGVMNHRAARALRGGDLQSYLERDGITHIFTSPRRLDEFRRITRLRVVPDLEVPHPPGRKAFRVLAIADSRGSHSPRPGHSSPQIVSRLRP